MDSPFYKLKLLEQRVTSNLSDQKLKDNTKSLFYLLNKDLLEKVESNKQIIIEPSDIRKKLHEVYLKKQKLKSLKSISTYDLYDGTT